MVHDISTIVLNNQILNFRKASLIIDKEHPNLYTPNYWNVKVYTSYEIEHYEKFLSRELNIKITTKEDISYSGIVAIGSLAHNEIYLKGKGILVEEQKHPF